MVLAIVTPAAASPAVDPAGSGDDAVTLITGDRVILRGDRPVVRPGAGREGIGFSVRKIGDDIHVMPADALPALADGRLDRRLFDVTGLIEAGYDDRARDSLPLIVSAPASGTRTTAELPRLGLHAVAAAKTSLDTVWPEILAGTGKVWLDGVRQASLDRSVRQIGAPEAWQDGLTGVGVTVAVLDTGVDQAHPDLASREVGERNFTDDADASDEFGHGTHVASTIAGTGATYRGVAPDARILDGKVLNNSGFGQESWILAGMQWAAEQGADIVNMSLGGTGGPEIDPLEEAVNTLSAEFGTLFVIAAGNSGPEAGTVGSPGSADAALTVGAVERDDQIAYFSSRGSLSTGTGIKPDITAPGVEIVAAQAGGQGHIAYSGTSMAAPHVAGSAALLAQHRPDWSGARLKAALMASARPTAGATAFDQGAGRVDVPGSLTQTLTTEPSSLSLGVQQWPHDDVVPVTKELAYHNDGAEDVRLDLAVEPGAPAGMFTVSATEVTVPAGGTASVEVTADPRVADQDGVFSAAVVATGAGAAVRTPVAVEREVESYDVTFKVLDETGAPTGNFGIFLVGRDSFSVRFLTDPDGEVTVRLPKGEFLADTVIGGEDRLSTLVYPMLAITGPTEVVFDARGAKPIDFAPRERGAEYREEVFGYEVLLAEDSPLVSLTFSGEGRELYTKHLGPAAAPGTLTSGVGAKWSKGGADYLLADIRPDVLFTGFRRVVPRSELATVNTRIDSTATDRWGERAAYAVVPDSYLFLPMFADRTRLPTRTTDYVTAGTWEAGLAVYATESAEVPEADFFAPGRKYAAGGRYSPRMNNPVFAPSLAGFGGAFRVDDEIIADIPMFGDGSGSAGWSDYTAARTELFRDGAKLGESSVPGFGVFQVPPDPGEYRLTATVSRDFPTSTRVDAAWTFRSEHVDGVGDIALSTIKLDADLRPDGTTAAGRPLLIPVALNHSDGTTSRPRSLSVEVSYDDGGTWRRVTVLGNAVAVVHHPNKSAPVSLRLKAAGGEGTSELTVIRAYHIKR